MRRVLVVVAELVGLVGWFGLVGWLVGLVWLVGWLVGADWNCETVGAMIGRTRNPVCFENKELRNDGTGSHMPGEARRASTMCEPNGGCDSVPEPQNERM